MEMEFGKYLVRQEKKNFNAIYKIEYGRNKFMTHRTSWRQATGVAKLLNESYNEGFEEAKEKYYEDYYS